MRVGNNTIYRTAYNGIIQLQLEQQRLGNEMNTGNRVNAPSDDSFYAPTILNSRYALKQVSQYRTNLEAAQTWLKASENSITSMETRLTRARVLAEQFSTGTYNSDQYMAASSEISQIINDLIVLANSQSNGSYIFGGTKSNIPPANYNLVAADPINLTGPGHRTASELYSDGTNVFLRLTRTQSGLGANIQIAAGNTLGSSQGLDFSRANWTVISAANQGQGQIIQNNSPGLTSGADLVSSQAGESFSWLSDTETGWQTFRTWATVTAGAGEITIDDPAGTPVSYNYTDAADLLTQLNSSGDSRLSAVLDSNGDVRILSSGGLLNIVDIAGAGANLNQDFSLDDVNNYINDGIKASGTLTVNGASPAFPPKDDEYVRIGDIQVTWSVIKAQTAGPYNTAADYAQGLADYINSHSGQYQCSVISSGSLSTVQIDAQVAGGAGNAVIDSNSYACVSSGALYGGLDPSGGDITDPGTLHGYGYSNLNITSTVKGQVLSIRPNPPDKLENVLIALDWIDDQGQARHTELNLRNDGEAGRVNVPELGPDFYLYRDGYNFEVGATFEFNLSHLQNNQEDLNVNYSANTEMRYNWNLNQILGEAMRLDLRGMETVARNSNTGNGMVTLSGYYEPYYGNSIAFDIIDSQNTVPGKVLVRASWTDKDGVNQSRTVALDSKGGGYGAFLPMLDTWAGIDMNGAQPARTGGTVSPDSGQIVMQGSYSGLASTVINYTVSAAGQLNSGNADNEPVGVTVDWIDDQGVRHQDEFTFECAGEDFAQEIPGSGGLKFYLSAGVYNDSSAAGGQDVFQQKITLSPENTFDGFFFNLTPGAYEAGDSFNLELPLNQQYIIDILEKWRLALDSEDMEEAQRWSQRALEAIAAAQANMLDCAADSGSRQNRISARINMLDSQMVFNTETLIALQETDMTRNTLNIQNLLNVYNNTLKVTGELSELFILDYLS